MKTENQRYSSKTMRKKQQLIYPLLNSNRRKTIKTLLNFVSPDWKNFS